MVMARWIPVEYQDYPLDRIAESDEQAMCTARPLTYFNAVRPPLWVTAKTYATGDLVHPPTSNSKIYECTVGGVSGSVEPGWGTTQDQTFTDGGVTWKTHDNFALVNAPRVPGDFVKSTSISPAGRKLALAEKMGVVTHTAGVASHAALIRSVDRTVRYVTTAQTTIGGNELESGRTTIFYELVIIVTDPKAP